MEHSCKFFPNFQDKLHADDLLQSAEKASQAFTGYSGPFSEEKFSVLQAIDRGLISKNEGCKYIEAQLPTGGIVDKRFCLRLTVDAASRMEFITDDFASQLRSPDYHARYRDINEGRLVRYGDLLKKCQVNNDGYNLFQVDQNPRSRYFSGFNFEPETGVGQRSYSTLSSTSRRPKKSSTAPHIKITNTSELVDGESLIERLESDRMKRENSTLHISKTNIRVSKKTGELKKSGAIQYMGERAYSDLTSVSSTIKRVRASIGESGSENESKAVTASSNENPRKERKSLSAEPTEYSFNEKSRTYSTVSFTGTDGKRYRKTKEKRRKKRKAIMVTNTETGEDMTLEQAEAAGLLSAETVGKLKSKVMNYDSDSARTTRANSKASSMAGSRAGSVAGSMADLTANVPVAMTEQEFRDGQEK